MSDIDRNTIRKSIKKKGFELKTTNNTDHEIYCFSYNGKLIPEIRVKISRGSHYKTYPQSLWCRMRKLLKLDSNKEVEDLLRCPLSKRAYIEKLESKKIL